MNIRNIQWSITLGALAVAAVHVWLPTLAIDGITVSLILTAIIPWLAPLFKKLKFPGGLEIEFQELQQAAARAEKAGLLTAEQGPSGTQPEYSFQSISPQDPNLALAGLRIEVERRLVKLAETNNLGKPRQGTGVLLRLLTERQLLTPEQQSVLADLIGTLNHAVHGAAVPDSAFNWAMQVGPQLLRALDQRIQQQARSA